MSTSSCSGPTTPTSAGAPSRGRNTCTTPSSDICCSASFSFFAFIASVSRTRRTISGAKLGTPTKVRSSPSVSVSPIRSVPWLGMPTTSPAKASSATERSWAKKNCGLDSAHVLAGAHQLGLHAAAELARAQPRERDAVAVVRIHIGLDLEHEGAHARLGGLDLAQVAILRARRRRELAETFQQIADAEIAQRAAEIDRRQMAFAKRLQFERLAGFRDQREFVLDLGDVEIGVAAGEIGDVDLLRRAGLGAAALEQAHAAIDDIVGAEEIAAAADRPGHRRGVERQRLFDLVQEIERVAALAVHLVDEGDDRNVAQPADFEQFPRPRLDALGGVDHHDRGIDRGQRAIGIFGKVLVARRVQQVEDEALELERHHRGHDRDAALALDLHPVGTGVAPFALGLDLPGEIDGAAEQQQLFGQRGLAGVRVGNDRKGPPPRHFI